MSRFDDNPGGVDDHLADLFWEYDLDELDWDEHRDFIARRVLSKGTWSQIKWLREKLGDEQLRDVIVESKGRDLSPRQLRFWQLILDLPETEVDRWLNRPGRQTWDRRTE